MKKHQISDSGTQNAHVSLADDAYRINIHIVPEVEAYKGKPSLIFTYVSRDSWDADTTWTPRASNLNLKNGDSQNNKKLRDWLQKIGREDFARIVWNRYVDLKDGRI